MTLTPARHADYWLTFRSSKHSQHLGQYQSAFRQRAAIDDVIDDGCVRPEIDVAEAEPDALPRQRMSTRFADVELRSPTDRNRYVI